MASPSEIWMQEFKEASKLADEVNGMISEKNTLPPSGLQTQRHLSSTRRKITILRTRIETLQSILARLSASAKKPLTPKEMQRRQNMLSSLSSKADTLNMSGFGDRDSLFGSGKKPDDVMKRANGLDSHDLVAFERQIIKAGAKATCYPE